MELQGTMAIFTVNLKRISKLIDEDWKIAPKIKKTTQNSHL